MDFDEGVMVLVIWGPFGSGFLEMKAVSRCPKWISYKKFESLTRIRTQMSDFYFRWVHFLAPVHSVLAFSQMASWFQ